MSSIYNEGFISHIRFFLSLTISISICNIKFSQILIQVLLKKLGIRIFILVSCWNINKTINFPLMKKSRSLTSHFLWVWLVWNFSKLKVSYHGPIRADSLSLGTLTFGPFQALVTMRSNLGAFWKFSKCSKRLSMTKRNFSRSCWVEDITKSFRDLRLNS